MDDCRVLTRKLLHAISILSCGLPALVHTASSQPVPVPSGYREVAIRHRVPPESLYSLALTESSLSPKSISAVTRGAGGQIPAVERPWPWTINVAGKGYRFASHLEAWRALQGFLKTHTPKRIDVGIAQVNLGWNGHHFTSTWEAFDPYTNLDAAATILRECYERNPGSWLVAAGCYHHPAGGAPAARYKAIVKTKLAGINGMVNTATAEASNKPTSTVVSEQMTALTWIEPWSQLP